MGYTGVQFAGFENYTAEAVKSTMAEAGIIAAGAHVQLELLENRLDETLKYHETIGNDLIIVPYLQESRRTTADDYKRTAELLNDIGNKMKAEGFSLGYHNHNFEFDRFDSETGFDILYENTDASNLKMELDCFWASYAGYDPVTIIEKYADRCVSLHIKDMKLEGAEPISTELGTGTLPLSTYISKGNEIGVKWFIVEQEHFTKDPLESAAENVKAIRSILEK
ncbi:TIM barrel protein [Oceanobacillus sp. 143]|nr:TIM barrel protein [Oceanobacillus sp. 143]